MATLGTNRTQEKLTKGPKRSTQEPGGETATPRSKRAPQESGETSRGAKPPERAAADYERGGEIFRLRALNRLAQHLNQTADGQTMVQGSLEILRDILGARAAWAFLCDESGMRIISHECKHNDHDFTLVGCDGLSDGHDGGDCERLCGPPDCACQALFRAGKLEKSVNIVQCTRTGGLADEKEGACRLLHHATVPLISRTGRIGVVNIATEDWDRLPEPDLELLTSAGLQIGSALERARGYEIAEEHRAHLEQELGMARNVQRTLIPASIPAISKFDLAAEWHSAGEMAGDFYDVFELPEGRWGIVVADVSGKGAAAAMYMAMIRSIIRSEAHGNKSPSSVLTELNRRLRRDSAAGMFVTVVFGVLDPDSATFNYCTAGHEPPLLRRADASVERQPLGGLLLGLFDKVEMTNRKIVFGEGDSLLIYTDGLTDAVDKSDEDYGLQRLTESLKLAPFGSRKTISHLMGNLLSFYKGVPQLDDITLLALNRK